MDDGDPARAPRQSLRWLCSVAAFISRTWRHQHRIPATVIPLLAGLIIIFFLALIPWQGRVAVIGDVVARSISLDLPEGLRDDVALRLVPARATLSDATQITRDGKAEAQGRGIIIEGAEVTFDSLAAEPGATLVLTTGQEALTLRVQGAGGNFAVTVAAEPRGLGESVIAKGVGTDHSLSLSIPSQSDLLLDEFAVTNMRFGQPRGVVAENVPAFSSSVLSGSIHLVDGNRSEALLRGSSLRLDRFQGAAVGLEGGVNGVHVWFTGTARYVQIGSRGHPVSIWPSVIEVIYNWSGMKLAAAAAASVATIMAAMGQWHRNTAPSS